MLSLEELKVVKGLDDLKIKIIEVNEATNPIYSALIKAKKALSRAKREHEALDDKIKHTIFPQAKLKFLADYVSLAETKKIAKSEIEEVVVAMPEVAKAIRERDLLMNSIKGLADEVEQLELEKEAIIATGYRLGEIVKLEIQRSKIKYGLTRIDVDGYLKEASHE